jgi:hypothetical protein
MHKISMHFDIWLVNSKGIFKKILKDLNIIAKSCTNGYPQSGMDDLSLLKQAATDVRNEARRTGEVVTSTVTTESGRECKVTASPTTH